MKVCTEKRGRGQADAGLSAPARPMTIQDLLRHTSGLNYAEFGKGLVHDLFIRRPGSAAMARTMLSSSAAHCPRCRSGSRPGTRWEYGRSTDVLGRVIEVIEGKPLGEVLAARVFTPLGMTDTEFHPPGRASSSARCLPKLAGLLRHGP